MQGPLSDPAEMGSGYRTTCSEEALLGKNLTHDELRPSGKMDERCPYQHPKEGKYVYKGHRIIEKVHGPECGF